MKQLIEQFKNKIVKIDNVEYCNEEYEYDENKIEKVLNSCKERKINIEKLVENTKSIVVNMNWNMFCNFELTLNNTIVVYVGEYGVWFDKNYNNSWIYNLNKLNKILDGKEFKKQKYVELKYIKVDESVNKKIEKGISYVFDNEWKERNIDVLKYIDSTIGEIVNKEHLNEKDYIGKGKIKTFGYLVDNMDNTLVVVNNLEVLFKGFWGLYGCTYKQNTYRYGYEYKLK